MPSKKQVLRVYAWAATLGHAYQNRLATGLRAAQLQKCRSLQPASSTKGDPQEDSHACTSSILRDRLASFDSLPQDLRLAPSAGVKLCTYHRWFGRPQNAACPSYWESPMGNAKLHRILRFRMGSHHLPVERERERKFNLSIQPALAYEDVSMLESSAKLRMAAKQ